MMKKQIYQKYMLRPLVYMAAYRLMVALIVLLVLVRLVKNGPAPSLVAGFLAIVFALLGFLVYLRMDGLRIPRVKYIRPRKKADTIRNLSGMSDHIDDDPGVTFEELEPDERDFCSLAANVINLVIFTAASFIL